MAARPQPVLRSEISTRDEAEAEDFIRQMYIENHARFYPSDDEARLTATATQAAGIGADEFHSSIDYSVECDPFDYYLFFTVCRGRVRLRLPRESAEVIVSAGGCGFFPLATAIGVDLNDLGMQIVRLPAERLQTTAEQTAGIAAADLRFHGMSPITAAMGQQWRQFVDLAAHMLLVPDSPVAQPILAEQLARTAAVTALHTFPNTAMTVSYQPGPGWVAPGEVRRAAGFIDAHADEPITLADIAVVAGVPVRALQHAFRRYYGITASGLLRRVRLERAHQQLQELRRTQTDTGLMVVSVARRWGWADMTKFRVAYQQRFGRLPGE